MKKLKQDLKTVLKELKALARKTEQLAKKVDRPEKAQAPKKRKVKAKARKRAPARKATAREKSPGLTATDQVLRIIKRSRKGVDAPTLIKETGFEDKKIRNILFRASKQKKLKRAGRGIYVAA